MKHTINEIADIVYKQLIKIDAFKCLDDIIKNRILYRQTALGIIKRIFQSSNLIYDNNIVYNTLDQVSMRYVSNG